MPTQGPQLKQSLSQYRNRSTKDSGYRNGSIAMINRDSASSATNIESGHLNYIS